jgi:hypothetical protein
LGRFGAPRPSRSPSARGPPGTFHLARPSRLLPWPRPPPVSCVPGSPSSAPRRPQLPARTSHRGSRAHVAQIQGKRPSLSPCSTQSSSPAQPRAGKNRIADLELARSSSAPVEVNPPSLSPSPSLLLRCDACPGVRRGPWLAHGGRRVHGAWPRPGMPAADARSVTTCGPACLSPGARPRPGLGPQRDVRRAAVAGPPVAPAWPRPPTLPARRVCPDPLPSLLARPWSSAALPSSPPWHDQALVRCARSPGAARPARDATGELAAPAAHGHGARPGVPGSPALARHGPLSPWRAPPPAHVCGAQRGHGARRARPSRAACPTQPTRGATPSLLAARSLSATCATRPALGAPSPDQCGLTCASARAMNEASSIDDHSY